MDLVFFGIQGSGKGTQAKKLAAQFPYDVFEAGGELRRIRASGTPLGEMVKSFIDGGKLVPFGIIMKVTREAVRARPSGRRILFDGVPRDTDQMRAFDGIMEEAGRAFRCVAIVVDKEEAVQRILGRAKIEGRTDDADGAVIRDRMKTFEEKTVPVIAAYRSAGKLVEVDGRGTVEEIYGRLKEALGLA